MNLVYKMFLILLVICSFSFGQLSFSENIVDFGRLTTQKGGVTKVYLKNLSDVNFHISAIEHYHSSFKIEADKDEIPAGDSLLFTISVHNERNIDLKDILVVKVEPEHNVILPLQASFYYFYEDVYSLLTKAKK